MEHPESTETVYRYNGDGLRVFQDHDGTVTLFLYDGNNMLQETDDTGLVEAAFTYIPLPYAEVLSQRRDTESSFYLPDGIRNIRQLTDDAQVVTDEYAFDAFGNSRGTSGMTTNSQRYKGQLLSYRNDPHAGPDTQSSMHFRNQSAATFRFTSEDPAEDDLNPYRPVGNNPVNSEDPSGLEDNSVRAWLRENVRKPIQTYVAEPAKGLADSIKQNVGDPIKTAAQTYIQQPIREHFHDPFKENVQPVLKGFAHGVERQCYVIGDSATSGQNPRIHSLAETFRVDAVNSNDYLSRIGYYTGDLTGKGAAAVPAICAAPAIPISTTAIVAGSVVIIPAELDISYHESQAAQYSYLNKDFLEGDKHAANATVSLTSAASIGLTLRRSISESRKFADLDLARQARDAAALTPTGGPNRDHSAYVGVTGNGRQFVGRAQPNRIHAEDAAQSAIPGGQMTEVMCWRRNKTTGLLEYREIPVCTVCQGKYPPELFPPGTKADPNGAWGNTRAGQFYVQSPFKIPVITLPSEVDNEASR